MRVCNFRECKATLGKPGRYCSVRCHWSERQADTIEKWYSGEFSGSSEGKFYRLSTTIRNHLLENARYRCTQCGWGKINPQTGRCPLEVNHIDGDYKNNRPNNLEILCPNCHSLTENYKALNKSGRGWRASYPQYELQGLQEKATEEEKERKRMEKVTCSCGARKGKQSKQCLLCDKASRKRRLDQTYPPLRDLIALVKEVGYLQAGKQIGVSDNAIRKHLGRNGIYPLPKKMKLAP